MTKLTICGIYELASVVQREKPDLVISITDPGPSGAPMDAIPDYPGKVLRLGFHDLDQVIDEYTAPAMQHARKLKAFLDDEFAEPPEHILVHCHLGVSRSPAIALLTLALLRSREATPNSDMGDQIVAQVFDAAPQARPNRRIVAIADRMLPNFGRSLFAKVDAAVEADEARRTPSAFAW
jgi:predicted protein tyrosine phosphatase